MPRKGENIYKRKDGRWEGRYIKGRASNGRAIYGYVYAKSYHDVKQKLCSAIASAPNVCRRRMQTTGGDVAFGKLALDWMLSMKPKVKESTYIRYRNLVCCYVLEAWNDVPIQAITAVDLDEYCNRLLCSGGIHGKGLSTKTVSDILSVIRSVLRYAQARNIPTLCTGKEVSIKQIPKRMPILSPSDQRTLCCYLMAHQSFRNMGILLCLCTGLRVGEICALRWEDVSLEEQTLCVHRTMQRLQVEQAAERKTEVIITTPKSLCSIRTIPIPRDMVDVLESLSPPKQGYVLTGETDQYVEPRVMQNHFRKVLNEAGIAPINFHALRHTFATRCVEVGFDVKTLSEILGHASVSITMNRYVHPTMEMKRENMQRLSGLFTVS